MKTAHELTRGVSKEEVKMANKYIKTVKLPWL
jgi:hypothetical protein